MMTIGLGDGDADEGPTLTTCRVRWPLKTKERCLRTQGHGHTQHHDNTETHARVAGEVQAEVTVLRRRPSGRAGMEAVTPVLWAW